MFRNVLKACTLLKAVEHRLHSYLLQPKWSKLLESGRTGNVINSTSKFSSPLKTPVGSGEQHFKEVHDH